MALSQIFNYSSDPVWGNDYKRAQESGNTELTQRYQDIINTSHTPEYQKQIGTIQAKTIDMGRNSPTSFGSISPYNGLEYNINGISRQAKPAPALINPYTSNKLLQTPVQPKINGQLNTMGNISYNSGLNNLFSVNRNYAENTPYQQQQSVDYNDPNFWSFLQNKFGWVS